MGPACTLRLSGTLTARNTAVGSGSIGIMYNGSFDATGGTVLADPVASDGGTVIRCRCAADPDGTCPPAPVDPAVDHFQCYRIRRSRGTAKFASLRGVTTVADRFGAATVDVIKPTMLCAPANASDLAPGAEAHAACLACYKVKPVRGTPKFNVVTPAFVTDHLGSTTLDAIRPTELCVPAQRQP